MEIPIFLIINHLEHNQLLISGVNYNNLNYDVNNIVYMVITTINFAYQLSKTRGVYI